MSDQQCQLQFTRAAPRAPAPPRIRWITTPDALQHACRVMAREGLVGLDVETTLYSRRLCLIQVAVSPGVYLIDPLRLHDLSPLAAIFADAAITKIIHNASFEKSVLGKQGMEINNIIDTLTASRRQRPAAAGGHSLRVVCERELNVILDKSAQTSDWSRRPLSPQQVAYAALDAAVLLRLYACFHGTAPTPALQSPS